MLGVIVGIFFFFEVEEFWLFYNFTTYIAVFKNLKLNRYNFFWQAQSIILWIKLWKYLFKNWWGKSLGKFKAKITRSCFLACVSHGGKWNRKINHIHERLLQIVCTRRATNGGEHVLPFFENKKKNALILEKNLTMFSTMLIDVYNNEWYFFHQRVKLRFNGILLRKCGTWYQQKLKFLQALNF